MSKLIAKLLYPIYRELKKIHNESIENSHEYDENIVTDWSQYKKQEHPLY